MVRNSKKITAWCFFLFIQSVKVFFQMPRGCCRFSPSCSEYAREAFEKLSFPRALFVTGKRVLKCHPLHIGGYDPLPAVKPPRKVNV